MFFNYVITGFLWSQYLNHCVLALGPYSNISDDQLDNLVRKAQGAHNAIGLRVLMGYLHSQGYRVQWERVCQSLLRTDPTGVYQRWRASIHRRQYWVPASLALWHIMETTS